MDRSEIFFFANIEITRKNQIPYCKSIIGQDRGMVGCWDFLIRQCAIAGFHCTVNVIETAIHLQANKLQ